MKFFTVLIITYSLQGYPMTSRIWLESMQDCDKAIRINEPLSTLLNADLFCKETNIPSQSIRPRLRPKSTQSEEHQ